jgi:hypothetical protein
MKTQLKIFLIFLSLAIALVGLGIVADASTRAFATERTLRSPEIMASPDVTGYSGRDTDKTLFGGIAMLLVGGLMVLSLTGITKIRVGIGSGSKES